MSIVDNWYNKLKACSRNQAMAMQNDYFDKETDVYRTILAENAQEFNGTAHEFGEKYGLTDEEVGAFLSGIDTSLETQLPLEEIEADSQISLKIIWSDLYKNMLKAKADWLYNMPEWDNILPEERRKELVKIASKYAEQNKVAVRNIRRDGLDGIKKLKKDNLISEDEEKITTGESVSASASDRELLETIVYCEARGSTYACQVAVASVVINRMNSSKFPGTIKGVIYQKGAFDAVSDGQINMTPDSTAIKAAQDALNGWDPVSGAIYYFNPATATNKWIWSRPVTVTIGKHRFCK